MALFKDGIPGLERSYYFACVQTGEKYSIPLTLNHPNRIELVKKFILWADVLVEIFAIGTEKLRLDYEHIKEIKPEIIVLRTCMHGHGYVLTGLSGLDSLTCWPERLPSGLCGPFTDYVAPLFNAVCLLAELDYRRRTGKGIYIDQSRHKAVLHWSASLIPYWVVNQQEYLANGNRMNSAAPHSVYRCKGEDRWYAISILNDQEWIHFCKVIEKPALAEDPQIKHYHFFHCLDHPEKWTFPYYHGSLFRLSRLPFELVVHPC